MAQANQLRHSRESGQVSVLAALLIVVALLFSIGIAVAGRVAVDRAQARTAADAVALAGADPSAQQAVAARWQAQGVAATIETASAHARSGQAQARSWTRQSDAGVTRSPALVAIVARAEQLLGGEPLVPLVWERRGLVFSPDDAQRFSAVATDFGFCPTIVPSGATSFGPC